MSNPTVDKASKQNFVVNIQDSEFGKLVVRWGEQDKMWTSRIIQTLTTVIPQIVSVL